MRIRDHDQLEVFAPKVLDHSGKIWVGLFVHGEGPFFVLEVDIQPKHVGRDAIFTETIGDFAKLRRREVGVPRLLEAQCPEWRERSRTSKPSPLGDDLLWFRAIH
jgi:hypothetical protein